MLHTDIGRDRALRRTYLVNPQNPLVELQGQRVALVGGSCQMIGSGLGSVIESYDVVIRVNCHWPCPQRYTPKIQAFDDIGHRTDILFHNASTGGHREDVKKLLGLRKIVFTGTGRFEGRFHQNSFVMPRIIRWANANNVETYVFAKYWTPLRVLFGTAGFVSLRAILQEPIKELFLAGYDFYTNNYAPEIKMINKTQHNPVYEREFFINNLMGDDRLVMADHVRDSVQ